MTLELTFWGVRGSLPVSGPAYEQGGGNTSCVSVLINQQQLIIFDAGSGLYDLNTQLRSLHLKTMHLFLSHLHLDHLIGLPFFEPLWDKNYTIYLYSICSDLKKFMRDVLFHPSFFPVTLDSQHGNLVFRSLAPGQHIPIVPNILMKTCALNHPGGAVGYRLEAEGKSICYITDVEHDPAQLDQTILHFIAGCDMFIYDSTYTEEEFQTKRGWGHSTHIRATELAKAASVKQLALFHHNPTHDDALLAYIESDAQKIFKKTFAARQGLKVRF